MLAAIFIIFVTNDVMLAQKTIKPLFRPDSVNSYNSGPSKLNAAIDQLPNQFTPFSIGGPIIQNTEANGHLGLGGGPGGMGVGHVGMGGVNIDIGSGAGLMGGHGGGKGSITGDLGGFGYGGGVGGKSICFTQISYNLYRNQIKHITS